MPKTLIFVLGIIIGGLLFKNNRKSNNMIGYNPPASSPSPGPPGQRGDN